MFCIRVGGCYLFFCFHLCFNMAVCLSLHFRLTVCLKAWWLFLLHSAFVFFPFFSLMAVWSSLFTILVRRWCQSSFAFGFPFARANLPVGPLSFPFLLWGQVTRCCFSPICFLALVSLLSLVYLLLPAFVLYCL